MARYVWNKKQKCKVPFVPGLKVDDNPDLVWKGTEDEPEDTPAAPTGGTTKVDLSVGEAIALLDPDKEGHFTGNGLPNANVLSDMVGRKVTSAERDEVWAEYQKGQDVEY